MKKTLTALALAAFAVLAAGAPAVAAPTDPILNHTSYWEAYTGDTCVKVEIADGITTYTLPASPSGTYTLLVLKAGSGSAANDVIAMPTAGVPYGHATGKDLSHVIYCYGDVEVPT
ncbi:hypothetical protein [Cellulomonas sp. KRMCY2]|uniref:hypothetical protein n=1 Tax=Cellulomonas sp. KRMCY2 TaxID=1304865 RepID=UPI00045E8832|nr:hypothetical protein [Cellulomonas sp. KRMCY2]